MLPALLFRDNGGTLQAKIIGRQRRGNDAFGDLGGLGNDGGTVVYHAEQHLIVLDGACHNIGAVGEKNLDML